MNKLFLLVPAQWAIARASGEPGATRPEGGETAVRIPAIAKTAPQPPRPPLDDIELCVPPQCNVALPSGNASDVGHAAATISLRELGYAPRPQRDAFSFVHDEVLARLLALNAERAALQRPPETVTPGGPKQTKPKEGKLKSKPSTEEEPSLF